jgi:diguanylate cyclase (GGDEF)-like protein/PAS domain S-box-containing protein
LGRHRDSLLGANVLDLVHPEDVGLAVESLGGTTATGPGRKVPIDLRVRHGDGSWLRLELIATNLLDDPAVRGIVLGARDVSERPEIEERLRTFEQRFEAAFDHAPLGRALLDECGRLLRVNPRFCELVERNHADLINLRLAELFPDRPELAIGDEGLAIRALHVESRLGRSDGRVAWLRITVAPVGSEDGPIEQYNVFVDDVTELRVAEADLRRADEEFRALIAQSSDIITVLEPDGSWRSSSAAGTRLLGYPEGLDPEGGVFSLLHPDDADLATQSLAEVLEGRRGPDEPVVLRVQSADGTSWVHLETVARNLVDHPAVRGIVLNSRDVTERLAAEEALHVNQARFRSLVQHATDLITVVDADTIVRYVSPSASRVLGFEPDELIGTVGSDMVHPDDLPAFIEAIMEQLESGAGEHAVRYRARHKDGGWRVLEGVTTNLLDDPNIQGFVTNARDITLRVEAEEALRRSDERFRSLVQHATDVVTVVDTEARISYVSPSIEPVLGYDPDELTGTDALRLIHPDDQARLFEASAEAIETGKAVAVEYRAVAKDGAIRYFEGITSDLTHEPSVAGFVTNARDITDRRNAEREAARLTEVLDLSNEVVVISSPTGRLEYANQRAKEFLGIGDEHHVGELTSVESRERLRDEVMPLVRRHGLWNGELTFRTTKGDEVPMVATVQAHREHGEIVLISTIAHDITDLKRAQSRLEYEATHDALTGLPNRAMLQELGEQALGRASRQHTTTGVLFLDLDGFKEINDTLGHDAGDRVLVELARSLRVGVRSGDLVARLGGDEFCVLCEGIESDEELLDLGQRICDVVAIPMRVHGRDVQVGTSVGIAVDRGGVETIGGLIRNADVALYRAKHAGGRRVELFDAALEESTADERLDR